MPRADYVTCKSCDRSVEECGPLSHQRLCADCAIFLVAENAAGIALKQGPAYQRWRLGTVARVLPRELVAELFNAGAFAEPRDAA